MTDEHRPRIRPGDDDMPEHDIDMLVSRVIDGDVDLSHVPAELRDDVARKAAVLSDLRHQLRRTTVNAAQRDSHIAVALSATRTTGSSRSLPTRTTFAIAASFVCLIALSVVGIRQFGSGGSDADVDTMTMAMDQAPTVEGSNRSPDEIRTGQSDSTPAQTAEQVEVPIAADSEQAMSTSEAPLPLFASEEEISIFVSQLDESSSVEKSVPIDPELRLCGRDTQRVSTILQAILENARVEIHVLSRNGFVVYDIVNCTVIVDRVTASRSTSD